MKNRKYLGDFINGKFVSPKTSNGEIISHNPGDLEVEKVVFPYFFEHINEASLAASRAAKSWKESSFSDRLQIITKYKEKLIKNSDSIAEMISFELGKPLWESKWEVKNTINLINQITNYIQKDTFDSPIDIDDQLVGYSINHPHGAFAVFASTDIPLEGTHRHFIPLLFLGNTVVLKSSKYVPMVSQLIAELMSDFPKGVFNLIHGDFEVGRRLAANTSLNGVIFTGTYEKALKLHKQILMDYRKILIFETGAKNSTIIWEDANYEKALRETFFSSFVTSGQRHSGTKRIVVHKNLLDRFMDDFHKIAKEIKVDYAFTTQYEPFMGPLISEKAVESYLRFQGIATREGTEEIMRGKVLERKRKGFYVSPSIHFVAKPNPVSVYEKSELFGPNVAFYMIEELEEAVELINKAQYGLSLSIYSNNKNNFDYVLKNAEVGVIYHNSPTIYIVNSLPFGGLRKSGNYRTLGSSSKKELTYPVSIIETKDPNKLVELPMEYMVSCIGK